MTRDKRLRGRGIRKLRKMSGRGIRKLRKMMSGRVTLSFTNMGSGAKRCSLMLKRFATELEGIPCDEWEAKE
jgi:hypothetical protein